MLDFFITPNPNNHADGTWRRMGGAEFDEWEALFVDALGCEAYTPGEDFNTCQVRSHTRFQEVAADYPLLSRAEDYYADAWYRPAEVEQVRAECARAKAATSNGVAVGVLTELIRVCDEALALGWGVWLACD